MQIYGLDFTSAPRRRKPITCAIADLAGAVLRVHDVEAFTTFDQFDAFLATPGPWIAGFDFPFGLPRELLAAWGLEDASWAAITGTISAWTKPEYLARIKQFRDSRPHGHKHPLRPTDALAGSVSPLMVYGVPVGRMLFEGAPRLLRAGVHVVPCHPTGDSRVALETYPGLAARRWTGGQSYKHDQRRRQTAARAAARRLVVDGLRAESWAVYGIALELPDTLADRLVSDGSGDTLDAVLCAVQASWAFTQPDYGVAHDDHAAQVGWIVAPELTG